jgi:ACS family tartrate transporter-like MFS transporter
MVGDVGRPVAEQRALRKVGWRLIPFLFIMYIWNYLDRTNLSFIKADFIKDLKFSDTIFGFGAGIFFIGYFLFEVPSNLILERVGARVWIARIMVTWGIISSLTMFTNSIPVFYTLRFLLGVAEAGFFPGMILYLTYWFPPQERARAISRFMTATPMSGLLGALLSTWLMTNMPRLMAHSSPALAALKGWQWVLLVEGIPSFLLGFFVLFFMTDRPEKAAWLTEEERDALIARLKREQDAQRSRGHFTLGQAFAHPQVLLLTGIYFALQIGFYGFNSWLPSVLTDIAGLSKTQANLYSMIPYAVAVVGMVLIGFNSDRTGERRLHIAVSCSLGAIGMGMAAFMHSPALAIFSLALAALGLWGTLGPFWASPTAFLTGTAAAGGIAFINSFGNLGGFVGPYTMGALKDRTHNFTLGLLTLTGAILLAGILSLFLHREKPSEEHIPLEPATVESES